GEEPALASALHARGDRACTCTAVREPADLSAQVDAQRVLELAVVLSHHRIEKCLDELANPREYWIEIFHDAPVAIGNVLEAGDARHALRDDEVGEEIEGVDRERGQVPIPFLV